MKAELQSLFEKISDAYGDGIVEQKHITDKYVDLRFLRATESEPGKLEDVEVAHVRLSIVTVQTGQTMAGPEGGLAFQHTELVKVVDHYGGEEVLVSPVISAIIAVSMR